MQNNIHTKFILTPISKILNECVNATKGISKGIETYPLCEYIMQTTFLKMTGTSEQKLKCICWEMATNDYEYRYDFLKNKHEGYSVLKAKEGVFKDLCNEIIKKNGDSDCLRNIFDESAKDCIVKKAVDGICKEIADTTIAMWQEREFFFFKNNASSFITADSFCNKKASSQLQLIEESLKFEIIVYGHRNICAHNLKSYQINLPTLAVLADKNYEYQNYFFRFAILILLDEIFMHLYKFLLE